MVGRHVDTSTIVKSCFGSGRTGNEHLFNSFIQRQSMRKVCHTCLSKVVDWFKFTGRPLARRCNNNTLIQLALFFKYRTGNKDETAATYLDHIYNGAFTKISDCPFLVISWG